MRLAGKQPPAPMQTRPYECRVFRSAEDGFENVRNAAVLIYWPHGFGDFVFLSTILPLLEPSNRVMK